jgi:hypothetical protein
MRYGKIRSILAMFILFPFAQNSCAVTVIAEIPCTKWIDQQKQPDHVPAQISQAWLLGYLSGINIWSNSEVDLLESVDAELVSAWMDRYCLANPGKAVIDGVDLFVGELKRRAKRK